MQRRLKRDSCPSIYPSVPSVKRVICDKTKESCAHILRMKDHLS